MIKVCEMYAVVVVRVRRVQSELKVVASTVVAFRGLE
jgi:hypothetical protein